MKQQAQLQVGDVVTVTVRDACNTYAARARGQVATCTQGKDQALKALMDKLGVKFYCFRQDTMTGPGKAFLLVTVLELV